MFYGLTINQVCSGGEPHVNYNVKKKKGKEKDQRAQEKCIRVFYEKSEKLISGKIYPKGAGRHVSCRLKSIQPLPGVMSP